MSARNMLIMAPAQAAQALVGVGAVVVFTRLMTPEAFGLYAVILSASMLAHTLALTWAEAAAFRFLPQAEREGEAPAHFATLLAVSALAGVLCAGIAALALLFSPASPWTAAAIGFAALFSAARMFTKIARETDRVEHQTARYAMRETTFVVGGFAIGVGMLAWTPAGPAAPFVGAFIAGVMVALLDAPRLLGRAKGGRASMRRLGAYAVYGVPLAAALALDLAMQTSTRALLAALEGEAAAGAYAAASGVTGRAIDIIFIWTALAFAPALLRAYEAGDKPVFNEAAKALARGLFALTAPAALGLWLVSAPLNSLLVGEGLAAQAAMLAPFVAIAALANGFAAYLAAECFMLSRRTEARTLILLPVAFVHAALTAVLVMHFGLIGAGMASAASAVMGLGALALVGARLQPLAMPWMDIAKCALGCAVMAGVVLIAPSPGGWAEIVIKAGVGAVVYAGVLFALDMGGLRGWSQTLLKRAPA